MGNPRGQGFLMLGQPFGLKARHTATTIRPAMRAFSTILGLSSLLSAFAQPTCDGYEATFSATTSGQSVGIFYNTAQPIPTGSFWEFGDGTSGIGTQIAHTFPAAGTYTVCYTAWWWNEAIQDSCWNTACQNVVIGDPCDGFEACFVTNNLGSGAFFFDNCTSQQGNTQFVWSFGDGGSSTGTNVDHLYQQPGTYTVCLTAYWGNCVDSTCTTVVVENGDPCDGLSAGFWWDSNGGTPENIFYSASTGDASHWLWSFGDGAYSDNGPQGTHTYPGPGEYQLCLTVYEYIPGTQDTCSVTSCQWVVIPDGNPCDDLDAGFSIQSNGLGVNFQNNVLNNEWSYIWAFGDGTMDYGPNPDHTFPSPGAYNVCLTVWTWDPVAQDTCFADHCAWVTVQGGDPCAGFTASMTWNAVGGNAVVLVGTTNTPASGTIWYFGDGTQGAGQTITHVYAQPGEYHVCFMAWLWNQQTQDSCWTEACQWITVGDESPCDGLNAGFTSVISGSVVAFENTVFNNEWSYLWSFGDGGEGYGPDPSHTYANSGTYNVCLTVWTWDPVAQDTCFADHCAWITVQGGTLCDQLNACFETSPIGTNGFQFFNCTTPQSGVQFVWHLGDGSTGTGISPDHVYQEPGTYTVCLTAYWENCVDEYCSTVTVSEGGPCSGDFSADFDWSAQGTAVVLHGTTNMPASGLIWFFGDGTTGYGEVITHLYEPPGPYTICLAAWYWNEPTQDTCWAEHCELVDPFSVGMDDHSTTALRIYPQPASDLVTIDGLVGAAVLRLFASDGRLVLQERSTVRSHRLDVTGLSTGMYVLNVDADGRSLRYRIAVQ